MYLLKDIARFNQPSVRHLMKKSEIIFPSIKLAADKSVVITTIKVCQ